MERFIFLIDKFTAWIGKAFAWCILLLTLAVAYEVFVRYVGDRTAQSIMNAQLDSWDKVLAKLTKDPFFKKVVDSQKVWSHRVAFYDIINSADYKLAFEHYFPGELPEFT